MIQRMDCLFTRSSWDALPCIAWQRHNTERGYDYYLQIHQRNKRWGGRGATQEQYWHNSL